MKLAVIVLVSLFGLVNALPSESAEVIAQFSSPERNYALGVQGDSAIAQGFPVAGSPTATEVQVYVWVYKGSVGSLQLDIRADSGGKPSQSNTASVSLDIAALASAKDYYEWISFRLPPGIVLSPGRWWIVLSVSSGSDLTVLWPVKDGNPYQSGDDCLTSGDRGVTWRYMETGDTFFKVFGSRDPRNTTLAITAKPQSVIKGGSSTIEVDVRDSNGFPVDGPGQVLLSHPDGGSFDDASLDLKNGKASAIWTSPNSTGDFRIVASYAGHSYAGTDYLASADAQTTITVNPEQTSTTTYLSLSSYSISTRGSVDVTVTVKYDGVIDVPGGTVSFSCPSDAGVFADTSKPVVNGKATTTWTAKNLDGTFTLTANYSGCTSGGTNYNPSSDSQDVTVNLTQVPTTTSIRVSPNYPYLKGEVWITVDVLDDLYHYVPGGEVLLSAPSGSFSSNPIKITNGRASTIWNAPNTDGDVVISATFQGYVGGGNQYMQGAPSSCVAHVTKDPDGSSLSCMTEWNTNYSWLASPITGTESDAHSFRDQLATFGWTNHDYGNDNCWQDHFKSAWLLGEENNYLDKHDFTYYSGHGSPLFITFDTWHDALTLMPVEASSSWGDGDAEFVALSACKTMINPIGWAGTMNGLHLICGFATNMDDSPAFGGTFASLMTKESAGDEPHTVCQSWFIAVDADVNISNPHAQLVIGRNDEVFKDYIWGNGKVASDPGYSSTFKFMSHTRTVPSPPLPEAGGPYNVTAGQALQLDGSKTTDPDFGDYLTYIWDCNTTQDTDDEDCDRNGFDSADDDCDARGPRPLYVFMQPGAYTIRLIVIDEQGNVASDLAVVNVASKGGNKSASLNASKVSNNEIEIVDNFDPASLPPEVMMQSFSFADTTLDFTQMMAIANYWGMSGRAELDALGNWNIVTESSRILQGQPIVDELTVNRNSGGIIYANRNEAYIFNGPPLGGLPDPVACINAANAFLATNGIPMQEAILVGTSDIVYSQGSIGNYQPDWSIPFLRRVNYRRSFNSMGKMYPAVGAGGKISVMLDEYADPVMFIKVWREVHPADYMVIRGAMQAVMDLHALGVNAFLPQSPLPPCRRILIDRIYLGYLEEGFSALQPMIYPVYVFDLTCQDEYGSTTTQAYMPAACPPLNVSISSPTNGLEIDYGQPITFVGTANGGSPPYEYKWTSDKDGLIGTSPSFVKDDLSVNQHAFESTRHTITLTVTDANGWYSARSVKVLIKPKSITEAKTSADGVRLAVLGPVVTLSFPDYFYVEKRDRSSGIWVISSAEPPENSAVTIYGNLGTKWEERCIFADFVEIIDNVESIKPLGMPIRSIGGADFGLPPLGQRGVTGGFGLNNVGILIKTSGVVEWVSSDKSLFILSDGSDNYTYCMLPVGVEPPAKGQFCAVTGVSSIGYESQSKLWRLITVRRQSDIQLFSAQ